MKAALGYDDALDVVGVHGIGGTIGAFGTGLYCTKMVMGPDGVDGFFIGWGAEGINQLGLQCLGFLSTWAYAFVATLAVAYVVKATVGLRTTEEQENTGLDLALHGEASYNLETAPIGNLKS
jgi:Amt family ammonium transporter